MSPRVGDSTFYSAGAGTVTFELEKGGTKDVTFGSRTELMLRRASTMKTSQIRLSATTPAW